MLKHLEIDKIRKVNESGIIVFYGIDLIRKELRATPKKKVEVVRNELLKIRNTLLSTLTATSAKKSISCTGN